MWSPVTWFTILIIFLLDLFGIFIHFRWAPWTQGPKSGQPGPADHPMTGKLGRVTGAIPVGVKPGKVKIDGVSWEAVAEEDISQGEEVVVLGGKGLRLHVARCE